MRASVEAKLRDLQAKAGAEWTTYGNRDVARHFGDWQAEWAALRQRCGLLDGQWRALYVARGEDRVSFLQGMLTTDLTRMEPGQGAYAALLTIQGRVVSDLRVFMLSDELWLDFPFTHAEAAVQHLEKHIVADDVEIGPHGEMTPLLSLEGPQAARVALAVFGESLAGLARFAHRTVTFDGTRARVARVSHSGEPGYLVWAEDAVAPWLWERCLAAGAEPVGFEALQAARIEAGIPWVGVDMDESTLISEVGIEDAITYGKGCYLGQEVVERVAARGQVQRRRVGLLATGAEVPQASASLQLGGREVGKVTSACWSPALRCGAAMGYVRREAWEEGTELDAVGERGRCRVRVAHLPFVRGSD